MSEIKQTQESNALVVYSHTNPFTDLLRLPERIFSFFETNLTLRQRWKDDGKGGTGIGFGASVYNGATLLSLFIEENKAEVIIITLAMYYLLPQNAP